MNVTWLGELHGREIVQVQKTHGIGGSERHIIDLCAGLRAQSIRSRVIWLEDPARPIDRLLALCATARIDAERIPIRSAVDFSLAARIRESLAARPPVLVHAHLIHATFYAAWALRRARIPLVATRHSAERYQRWPPLQWVARWCDRSTERILAPSRWVASYVRRWDGTPASKLGIVPHGIDLGRFHVPRAGSRAADRFTIGAVARLHPSKNHALLLRAFAALSERTNRADLVIVGEGPTRPDLERLAVRLMPEAAATGRVRFLGERDDIVALYRDFDAAVIPGEQEGFGLAALEAMASNVALVAPRGGALPEIISDGVNGLLYVPGDSGSLTAALGRLMDEPGLRAMLVRNAAETVRGYSLERMATETARAYHEALSRKTICRPEGGHAD